MVTGLGNPVWPFASGAHWSRQLLHQENFLCNVFNADQNSRAAMRSAPNVERDLRERLFRNVSLTW